MKAACGPGCGLTIWMFIPGQLFMLDHFAVPAAIDDGAAAAAILRLPIFKAHLGRGVLVGGWFSQGMLDLHLLPVDHEPEELCLHRPGLNRRAHLIDAERVGPVLIEFLGKAVDGDLGPFCLFGTQFGEARSDLNLS